MYAVSEVVGTVAGFQFDASSQLPVPAIQWMSPPMRAAEENSDVPSLGVLQAASLYTVAVATTLLPTTAVPAGTLKRRLLNTLPAMQPLSPRCSTAWAGLEASAL